MATLSIAGKTVTVDDALLKAAPDVQNAAIEEIAKSIGVGQNDNAPLIGGASSSGPAAVPVVPLAQPQTPGAHGNNPMASQAPTVAPAPTGYTPSSVPWMDPINAAASSAVNAIPIVGPTLSNWANQGDAAINNALGFKPQTAADRAQVNAGDQAQFPAASVAGQIAGTVAPFVAGGEIPAVSKALGMSGGIVSRVALGGASNAAISYADTLARGGDPSQAGNDAMVSGGIAAALPVVGRVVGAIVNPVVGKALGTVRALLHPDEAAQAAIGGQLAKDAQSAATPLLNSTDQAAAAANGQPLLNIDRGGPNVRALARTASVTNPDARAIFNNTAQERYQAQGARTGNFIDDLMGGPVNDVAYQAQKKAEADLANNANYTAANSSPEAQSIFTPQIQQLMQSDQFRSAVKAAESTGTDKAAIAGVDAVKSPFNFDANGVPSLKVNSDGSTATPNLQFWNEVKINLDRKIGMAQRSGDNAGAADLIQMKKQLVSGLDTAVPLYQQARQGAAAAFKANDAFEAGQNFVTQDLHPNTANAAMAKMSPQDKEAFAVGFASTLKDKILNAPNSRDLMNQIYGSDAAKRKIVMALGQDNANQFEQFVRVENVMDQLRKMGGGSDTANKLAEMGALGLGGSLVSGLTTGNWQSGGQMGLALGGARMIGSYANRQMMSRIAQILSSGDPMAMQRAVKLAAGNPDAAKALKALQTMLSTSVRAAPLAIGAASTQPQAAQP